MIINVRDGCNEELEIDDVVVIKAWIGDQCYRIRERRGRLAISVDDSIVVYPFATNGVSLSTEEL